MDEDCEVKVGKKWVTVSIDRALGLHPDRVKRCPECHGKVRAHKAGVDGMRAHFEHFIAHDGCSRSRSVKFSGASTTHPRPLT